MDEYQQQIELMERAAEEHPTYLQREILSETACLLARRLRETSWADETAKTKGLALAARAQSVADRTR